MDDSIAVKTSGLTKKFGDITAVDSLDLTVGRGEIYSLLGPNGAGKSTTISMLCGLLKPTAGEAFVFDHSVGRDPMAVKRRIGVVPQEVALYPDLSAADNLEFWGRMYGLGGSELRRRIDEVLELVQLSERRRHKIDTYSGGMKRRINIAVALLHEPELVIMDEPTVGIDPQSRRHILDSVKALNANGMTVLYTTHYMEEAAELSHHIGIMDHGKLVAHGSHEELVKIVGERDRIVLQVTDAPDTIAERWTALDGVDLAAERDGEVSLLVDQGDRALVDIVQVSIETDCHIQSIDIQEPNLEAVFLHLTGRELRD